MFDGWTVWPLEDAKVEQLQFFVHLKTTKVEDIKN